MTSARRRSDFVRPRNPPGPSWAVGCIMAHVDPRAYEVGLIRALHVVDSCSSVILPGSDTCCYNEESTVRHRSRSALVARSWSTLFKPPLAFQQLVVPHQENLYLLCPTRYPCSKARVGPTVQHRNINSHHYRNNLWRDY